jgi:hypothetical protein
MAGTITGRLSFLASDPLYKATKPYGLTYTSARVPRSNVLRESHELAMHDLRERENELTFEKNGIAVLDMQSTMCYEDFEDRDKIVNCFCAEVAAILLDYMAAEYVEIFDYNVWNFTAVLRLTDPSRSVVERLSILQSQLRHFQRTGLSQLATCILVSHRWWKLSFMSVSTEGVGRCYASIAFRASGSAEPRYQGKSGGEKTSLC